MNKNNFAKTPPMGWNSYDYYDTTVTEEQVKGNADYMAKHLKEFGWEYIVIDIEWYAYDTGSQRKKYQYIPFWKVEMDEYSRLLPCPDRFPSSKGGKGFQPLADYIHSLGLKFGIHIMRGIPRIAAHTHTKILGSDKTANEIASPNNVCAWNPDMYGLNLEEGSQEYYNSIMNLYASWGVDFIKCDDICRMDMPSAKKEIELLHHAIMQCGRPIILSLSPGPALIDEAWHYETYANMWRITDDFWDDWKLLKNMFDRCELWQKHVSTGCYPDCDMLPIGKLSKAFLCEHNTNFTKEEQMTMMTLWCIFGSPLMLGCELTLLDEWTLSLITNSSVLRLLSCTRDSRQILRTDNYIVWTSKDTKDSSTYLALFNIGEQIIELSVPEILKKLDLTQSVIITDLWEQCILPISEVSPVTIRPHACKLIKIDA